MRILVVGAGVVGVALAEQLSREGHRVTIVDKQRTLIRAIQDKVDVLGVVGSGSSPKVLEQAGVANCDMAIAVTSVDEVNLVVGMIASRMGVKHCITRIRNPEFSPGGVVSPLDLGIDRIINPEPAIVDALVAMTKIPGVNDVSHLVGGNVLMLGFDIHEDSPCAGRTPAELRGAGDLDAFLFLYITRGDEVIVPRGYDRIEPGDKVHVLVSADMVPFLLPFIHKHPKATRRVIISGASRIGLALGEALRELPDKPVLIEPDADLAREAAARLDSATVLHGDATDGDLLEEAGIESCDLFCALSENDQHNMLAALLAKRQGAGKTAVVVHHPEYVPVMASLGSEIVISPRLVTVGEILMHVRRGQIHSVTRLHEAHAEILDLEAAEGCPATKKPLASLKFPKQALVGALVRDDTMLIPSGQTHIQPGDRVIVFALPESIEAIEKLFTAR